MKRTLTSYEMDGNSGNRKGPGKEKEEIRFSSKENYPFMADSRCGPRLLITAGLLII